MTELLILLTFLLFIGWLLFCAFSGNYLLFITFFIVVAIYLMNKKGIGYLFPLTLIPFIPLFIMDVFAWRELFFKSKIWKKIEYIPSILVVVTIITSYCILNTKQQDFVVKESGGIISLIFFSIAILTVAFFLTKMFITDLLFFVLNRLKTVSRTKIVGKIDAVKIGTEGKMVIYYIHLDDKIERVRLNILGALYLKLFAINQKVEFEFKRGFFWIRIL